MGCLPFPSPGGPSGGEAQREGEDQSQWWTWGGGRWGWEQGSLNLLPHWGPTGDGLAGPLLSQSAPVYNTRSRLNAVVAKPDDGPGPS